VPLPGHAAVREQLKQRLTNVLAEQQHRPLRQRNTYNLGRAFTDTWFLAFHVLILNNPIINQPAD